MSLSPRQLAKLRELGRASNELELRHEARRAAIATQRDYLVTLNQKLELLPRARDAALRDVTSREQSTVAVARVDQEDKRLRDEIRTARAELEHLQEQLAEITHVSAPLRELVERTLRKGNLSRGDAGLAFRGDASERRESIAMEAN